MSELDAGRRHWLSELLAAHDALAAERDAARAERDRARDHLDLMVDEFRRIRACPGVTTEIAGLCQRAEVVTVQHVPLIAQRDAATAEAARLQALINEKLPIYVETIARLRATLEHIRDRCCAASAEADAMDRPNVAAVLLMVADMAGLGAALRATPPAPQDEDQGRASRTAESP